MGIFYISRREKIRKNYFAPSEKYACYAPGINIKSAPDYGFFFYMLHGQTSLLYVMELFH